MPTEHIRELWQEGIMVAKVIAPTMEAADREAGHYLAMYALDGTETRLVSKTKTRPMAGKQ